MAYTAEFETLDAAAWLCCAARAFLVALSAVFAAAKTQSLSANERTEEDTTQK